MITAYYDRKEINYDSSECLFLNIIPRFVCKQQ